MFRSVGACWWNLACDSKKQCFTPFCTIILMNQKKPKIIIINNFKRLIRNHAVGNKGSYVTVISLFISANFCTMSEFYIQTWIQFLLPRAATVGCIEEGPLCSLTLADKHTMPPFTELELDARSDWSKARASIWNKWKSLTTNFWHMYK